MPTISYDGQSFLIDGRRIWLVSGTVHYARSPRGLWRSRLRAARQAGLNCIDVVVCWQLHEPRPGVFDFEGDADLAGFVKMVGEEGMYCVLRPGPYAGAGWDFGGMPGWLNRIGGMKVRQSSPVFLEACARFLGAVMGQVKDLQVTVSTPHGPLPKHSVAGGNGPIVLMQAENHWQCHNPEEGQGYLREVVRYLRENGCEVPVCISNRLWQRVEGAFDAWSAEDWRSADRLAGDLRQLRVVQGEAPAWVSDLPLGGPGCWGVGDAETRGRGDAGTKRPRGDEVMHRLAGVLAVGGQCNVSPFFGGTYLGSSGGRVLAGAGESGGGYVAPAFTNAPLGETGERGERYLAVKRIGMFASQFGHVFSHLIAGSQPTVLSAEDRQGGVSVIHRTGAQGDVVFLLRAAEAADEAVAGVGVLLPDGRTITVAMGRDRAAWFLLNATLAGDVMLSYTNLRPWALVEKKLLVLFGPAGTLGQVSVNGSEFAVEVPTGKVPVVERREDVNLLILNEEQVDAAYLSGGSVVIGAMGLDEKNEVVADAGWETVYRVSSDGEVGEEKVGRNSARARKTAAPVLGTWERAGVEDFVNGTSEKFKVIAGPANLEALKCDRGYGWYRVPVGRVGAGEKFLAPGAGDRLHLFSGGRAAGVIGEGPGAVRGPFALRGEESVVALADNLGRFSDGWRFGESKGLCGHVYAVKTLELGKGKVSEGEGFDPFELGGFWPGLRTDDGAWEHAVAWNVREAAGESVVVEIEGLPVRAMVVVNDRPVGMYDPHESAGWARFLVEARRGKFELKIATPGRVDLGVRVEKYLRVYRCLRAVTEKGEWAFAAWGLPKSGDFGPVGRGEGLPAWYRAKFSVGGLERALFLEPRGMSKGQIYLNGKNVSRYFVATGDGKGVGPQARYYLPEGNLKVGENEVLIFDENGKSPARCRLVHEG